MPNSPSPSHVPADLEQVRDAAWQHVKDTPGYLSENEARFLMLAAACAPVPGTIVEIGSFKGRSTVALASVAKHYGLGRVHAVDPHTAPSSTDPSLHGKATSFDDFLANVARAGVADAVTPHRMYSRDFAPTFAEPIRLLWIDGDHTEAGARADLEMFRPHLVPGAIVAMHDVLGTWYGSLKVFCDDVLGSDDFGVAGFCGSIGWAQYTPGAGHTPRQRWRRARLALPARQLLPVAKTGEGLVGLNKLRYKLWRPLAPHGAVDAKRWVKEVSTY
jgi:predicted O-methyltransferase YrrM